MLQLYYGDADFAIWCRLVNVNKGLVMFLGRDDSWEIQCD